MNIFTIKNIIWSLGVLASLVGLYSFFYVPKPKITILKTSEFSFYSDEKFDDYNFLINYKNKIVDPKLENIFVTEFKISNSSLKDIKPSDYIDDSPWQISVKEGQIIEAGLIKSSDKYIDENFHIKSGKNAFVIDKFAFDSREHFLIRVVTLSDGSPAFSVGGKISGFDFKFESVSDSPNAKMFLAELFYGDLFVHVVRIVIYLIFWFFLLIIGFAVYLAYLKICILLFSISRKIQFQNFLDAKDSAYKQTNEIPLRVLRNFFMVCGEKRILYFFSYFLDDLSKHLLFLKIQRLSSKLENLTKGETDLIRKIVTVVVGDTFLDQEIINAIKAKCLIVEDRKIITSESFDDVMNDFILFILPDSPI